MTRHQVDELARQFQAAAQAARELASEFSARELGEPPSPGAWSAADNLMHLTVSSRAFVPRMARTLRKLADAGRRTDRPTRAAWIGRLYAWALEPPARFRARAPRAFAPPPRSSPQDALPAFLAEQEQLLALVEQSAGLDLGAFKVPSPISRWIRYDTYSAFRILVAHERRHLWQARRAAQAVRASRQTA